MERFWAKYKMCSKISCIKSSAGNCETLLVFHFLPSSTSFSAYHPSLLSFPINIFTFMRLPLLIPPMQKKPVNGFVKMCRGVAIKKGSESGQAVFSILPPGHLRLRCSFFQITLNTIRYQNQLNCQLRSLSKQQTAFVFF